MFFGRITICWNFFFANETVINPENTDSNKEMESNEIKTESIGIPRAEDQCSKFKMDEPQLTKQFKQHSVKNATIVAVVSAPEAYDTLSTIYNKTNIKSLDASKNI